MASTVVLDITEAGFFYENNGVPSGRIPIYSSLNGFERQSGGIWSNSVCEAIISSETVKVIEYDPGYYYTIYQIVVTGFNYYRSTPDGVVLIGNLTLHNDITTAFGTGFDFSEIVDQQVSNTGLLVNGSDKEDWFDIASYGGPSVWNLKDGDNFIEAVDGADMQITATGGGNNQFMLIGYGNSTITTGSGDDQVTAGGGVDVIHLGGGDDYGEGGVQKGYVTIFGEGGEDSLRGDQGDDYLDGGDGVDTLRGGKGNDTYIVDRNADVIVEVKGEGDADWIKASATYDLALGVQVEKLSTIDETATTAINLYGNGFAQEITGNAGVNLLSDGGRGHADTLIGLGGDDTYRVYNSGDIIVETEAQGGGDRIQAAVSYTLKAGVYVEIMRTIDTAETASISLYGNEFGQTITGNAGANALRGYDGDDKINGGAGDDRISGGRGNDTLAGNIGADTYYFSYALDEATNVDTIKGFSGIDLISLSSAIFTKAGPVEALAASAFVANADGKAADASDRILYETDTGILRYDPDGTGAAAAIKFAVMAGLPTMNSGDFVIA